MNVTRILIIGTAGSIQFYSTLNGIPHFTSRSDDADFLPDEHSLSIAITIAERLPQAKGERVRAAFLETDL